MEVGAGAEAPDGARAGAAGADSGAGAGAPLGARTGVPDGVRAEAPAERPGHAGEASPESFPDASPFLVRVALPAHLRTLAGLTRGVSEIRVEIPAEERRQQPEREDVDLLTGTVVITIATLLDALEEAYPMLRGTIRAHNRGERRAHLRYFGEGRDLSFMAVDAPLPSSIVRGEEPFIVIGAISGG